jgi:hypothetical protein
VPLLWLLVTLIVWFSKAAAAFDPRYNAGQWLDLGAGVIIFTVFPVLGLGCCALAWSLLRRDVHRLIAIAALTIAIPLGFPPIALPLARTVSANAADLWLPQKEAADTAKLERALRTPWESDRTKAIRRHYDALTTEFADPQVISHGELGLILLENHEILTLHGIKFSAELRNDLMRLVNEHLQHKRVMVRLPSREEFNHLYSPGAGDPPPGYKPEFFGLAPKDDFGYRYGTIPCLIYVDGLLLNARYEGTPGSVSDFDAYKTPPVPEASVGALGRTEPGTTGS